MILLNPGPVTLSARVRQALQQEDLCHREPEFAALTLDVRDRIEHIYPAAAADYAAVLVAGSGSCAVEAMLSTFAAHDRATLVVCNGVYGERMAQMLAQQRKPYVPLLLDWQGGIDVAKVEQALDAHPDVATLAVVHHETTTGRLNQLDELAALCQRRHIGLLVDAVSSFGGEEIPFERWQPLAIAATANKCLHGIPGVAFVLALREVLATPHGHATTLYLDLERYYVAQQQGWSPFTQPVQAFQALQEALREFAEGGGWQARQARFTALSNAVAQHLAAKGVQPLLGAGESSSMLRAYHLPARLPYDLLHDALKAHGFVIYAGQGALAAQIFRIATMGAIADGDLQRLLAAFDDVFAREA
ncbi:2-aminoethylphosphonate--pyruvate transaminase [Andreprevotia sp. IGB-42]|uniref:2-aminoethylphosphonate aminotransferase n=1 Tax=Andreprevotia sp. IGB-42 TaxID=2497473 RepID=UPI00135A32D3|nr:2-aminoethylphosphonate aminotransferase [Andreprevotia sp. IGB-42]KAF0815044.1 2-aminoethylphosphonate--pyruvate transaminase [Andreprevotia sp. IGB-42]